MVIDKNYNEYLKQILIAVYVRILIAWNAINIYW